MKMKSQMIVGVEKFNIPNAAEERRHYQRVGSIPGSLNPGFQRSVEMMTDMESIRSMEERYAIREEGIF